MTVPETATGRAELAAARVARGAAVLDELVSGWRQAVLEPEFKMSQFASTAATVIILTGGKPITIEDLIDLGLGLDIDPDPRRVVAMGAALVAAWKAVAADQKNVEQL